MKVAAGTFRFAAALLGAVLAMSGCRDSSPAAAKPSGGGGAKVTVVATTGMIADAAKIVAGERATVTALMGPGVDPHLYRPTPGDIRQLSEADLILYNGLLLEGRMVDVLVKLAAQRPTVAVSEKFDPAVLREPPEMHGHADPHVWFDVSLWMKGVERVRDALLERDPAGRETIERNANAYLKELGELHAWCKTELARVPAERRVLVTAHDAFGYFGRAYDVEVRAIQGVSTDSEASVQQINHLVDMIVSRKIGAVFVESSVPAKTVEALVEGCKSRGHNVKIGGELFSDAMGAAGTPEGNYIGMVRHNVRTIVAALLGEGGAKGP